MTYAYEFTAHDGRSCCKSDKIENLCEHCRAAAEELAAEGTPPDPYGASIATLRAAANRGETFEDRFKAARLAALNAEYAKWDAEENR